MANTAYQENFPRGIRCTPAGAAGPNWQIDKNGNANFNGSVSIGGDIRVSGDIVLDDITIDTLTVSGNATIAGTLAVTGAATFSSTLQATTITATTAFRAADGSAGTPSLSFTNDTDTGMYRVVANNGGLAAGGVQGAQWDASGLFYVNSLILDITNADVKLARISANVLGQINGTTAQEFRVYGTTTGPKYMSMRHNGAGTGFIGNFADESMALMTNNDARWILGSSSNGYDLYPITDNTQQLGQANQRVAEVHVGGFVAVGTNPSSGADGEAIRISNNNGIYFRNAANNGDIPTIAVSASNEIVIGSSGSGGGHITYAPSITLNHAGADTDTIIKSDTNASAFVVDGAGDGNVGIGGTGWGTSAMKVLGIATGTAPSTSPADMIQIYSQDVSAGNCSLAWRQEMAPYGGVAVASTDKIPVRVNGTVYYVLATTVA